ncbi:PDZ domain-containing protein [Pseudidiomarina sp. 1ASP75-14]|uniref:PDZ domain-containing protein n=1 Tax=Pseudidiomarina terrestris TaxID=2820060 RepID=UPI00264CAC6B|nr:PDZ domain-containing protein [Pseudidiomarina sp. 1ASP75-14]MDN7138489.1 PDZ domain-containing protein [Pseudidiomarina sp. 1ASP75-14]
MMNRQFFKLSAVSLLALVSIATSSAQEQDAREHARAAAVAAAKADGKATSVTLEEPTRSYFDWGAVLNPSGRVMSVRDDSVAQEMGIEVGDRILSVDGQQLAEQSLQDIVSYLETLDHGNSFAVTVQRQGQTETLSGRVKATVIPGWRLEVDVEQTVVDKANEANCGRVSVFVTPPEARDLYPAYFVSIDGDNVLTRKPIFKLSPGKHSIEVHELISDPWVRRSRSINQPKQLELNVEPDTTYYIAARFIREKRLSSVREEYWEPVVWREVKQQCDSD